MEIIKEIQFSEEFIYRLFTRNIISMFGNDLKKCKDEIKRLMIEESVIIDNPSEKYPNQSWCVINIKGLGLCKIPIAETPKYIKAITIAHPVTDSKCIQGYNDRINRKQ